MSPPPVSPNTPRGSLLMAGQYFSERHSLPSADSSSITGTGLTRAWFREFAGTLRHPSWKAISPELDSGQVMLPGGANQPAG